MSGRLVLLSEPGQESVLVRVSSWYAVQAILHAAHEGGRVSAQLVPNEVRAVGQEDLVVDALTRGAGLLALAPSLNVEDAEPVERPAPWKPCESQEAHEAHHWLEAGKLSSWRCYGSERLTRRAR